MKKDTYLIGTLVAVVAAIFVSCSGCSTTKEISYKTLAATAATVDTAMKAYANARVAGKVDDATHAKVVDIKLRYEKAFLAAATAAQVNLESPTPTEVVTIATQLVEIINAATKK